MAKLQIEDKNKLVESLRADKVQQKKLYKEKEELVNKYENSYNPKLKETRKFQKQIYTELE